MHHLVLDQLSRGESPLHRRDPRVKAAVAVALLILIARSSPQTWPGLVVCLAAVLLGIICARLPIRPLLLRACIVLPFSGILAAMSLFSGDAQRALSLFAKSYLSALLALTLIATTPLPRLIHGLAQLRVPVFFLTVVQLIYRYLFVISEQAQHMRIAAACRGSGFRRRIFDRHRFQAAAGAVAVLFARSYQRAENIHFAMLARGFGGLLPVLENPRMTFHDWCFLFLAPAATAGIQILVLQNLR